MLKFGWLRLGGYNKKAKKNKKKQREDSPCFKASQRIAKLFMLDTNKVPGID